MKFLFSTAIEKIQFYIQLEAYFIFLILIVSAYLFYRFFLKSISQKRHNNLKSRFFVTSIVLILSAVLATAHWFLFEKFDGIFITKIINILAIGSLFFEAIGLIKLAQIFVYLYLFFMNISQGIPRLIVNLFTVIFSIIVASYFASEIFSINITAMLATSAVFSLVLGLALQDTLGNLFSGVAMQIGQPFTLGDWVEITADSKKWIGQIQEITWRATFITSFSDELIMIPNKTIAQSQIIIFSNNQRTLRHSQVFRLNYEADLNLVKSTMVSAIKNIADIQEDPAPRVLLTETNESWVIAKIFYSTKDFSIRYRTGDQVIQNILTEFNKQKIKVASSKIQLVQT